MGTEHQCCICLSPPSENSPLYLLDCGCKVGWFHQSCENEWLDHIPLADFSPRCPACRRPPKMKTNYSFSPFAGNPQKELWFTLVYISAESACAGFLLFQGFSWAWILPIQSAGMGLIPFLKYSDSDLLFYLKLIRGKYSLQLTTLIFSLLFHIPLQSTYPILEKIGFGLYFLIFLFHVCRISAPPHERGPVVHPLTSFAISREIEHRAVYSFSIEKPTSTTVSSL